ncbi:MAG: thiamine phosphate synthase [Phycisphaerales bacterium]|nr:thiamine phosphate synthase [Phycisphaerales bacterium]
MSLEGHMLDRLVDACRNRVAEGLRTIEDLARFVLDDAGSTRDLKRLRHDLRDIIASGWSEARLLAARDVAGDTGKDAQTSQEFERANAAQMATAAAGRVREGLRSLEEAAKVAAPLAAPQLEALRYQATELAGRVQIRLACASQAQWRLCLLLTVDQCRGDWRSLLEQAVAGGIDCVQVREKHLQGRRLFDHAAEVVERAHDLGVAAIINDRPDVAAASGADGVHLGQDDCTVEQARRVIGQGRLIGVSTHGVDEAKAALANGASYIGIGPIFTSSTRADLDPAGPERVAQTLKAVGDVPHLAIGGIDPTNAGQVVVAGGQGVAVGGAICSAEDPEATARSIRHLLDPVPAG